MNYERGLEQLRQHLRDTVWEQDFQVYELRLRENIHKEQLYGTTEQQRADRAQIIDQLNRLAKRINASFNDLCQDGNIPHQQPVPKPDYVIGKDTQADPKSNSSTITLPSSGEPAPEHSKAHTETPTAEAKHRPSTSPTPTPGTTILTYDVHADWIGTVAWSPDGTRIVSAGGDGTVRIWEASSGRNIITYRGHAGGPFTRIFTNIWKVSWSPDGQYIASGGSGPIVRIWDASTGQDVFLYHGHETMALLSDIFTLSWSPDGTRIASACSFKFTDQTIHIWNAATGSIVLKYAGHKVNKIKNITASFSVTNLAWSPNGQYIASSGSDENVKKWQPDPTTSNKSIQVWSPITGQYILTCEAISTWFYDVVWSPDNKYIAAAGSNKVVGIWEATTGKNVFTYTGHTKEVRAVAWSPDGSAIASAGNDNTVQIWQPFTEKKLPFVYRGHTGNVATLAWSPDGKRIASAGVDKTVRIWQAV